MSVEAERLRAALQMHQDGVALMRQNLRRRHDDADEDQIDALVGLWLRERPGAQHGHAEGTPVPPRS